MFLGWVSTCHSLKIRHSCWQIDRFFIPGYRALKRGSSPKSYKTSNLPLVSLFGIVAALNFAIMEIDKPSTNIRHFLEHDDQLYDYIKEWSHVELTRSHAHLKAKEPFIFTESQDSMVWLLSGKSQRNEEVRAKIKDIKTMSEEIERSGIHIEIHFCPSIELALVKEIAIQMARELAKNDLETDSPV